MKLQRLERDSSAVAFFFIWLLLGILWSLGIVGLASIGLLILPVAAIGTAVAVRKSPSIRCASGALAGSGLPMLYIAALNWQGPGTVCRIAEPGQICIDELDPTGWIVAGVVLVVVGVGLFLAATKPSRGRHEGHPIDW
jgi:hypothetical protein